MILPDPPLIAGTDASNFVICLPLEARLSVCSGVQSRYTLGANKACIFSRSP